MMKTHVQKIGPEATLAQAVDLMDLYQTPALPVVDADNRLVGMITERDIAEIVLRVGSRGAISLTVEKVMSRPAVAVEEDTDVMEAARLMLEKRLKRVPVVTDAGEVVGMLNRVDVLQALFEGTLSDVTPDRT